jgi:DMSO/TMAO reductase YedYZ molybdopterin-dependent catalytic subunit
MAACTILVACTVASAQDGSVRITGAVARPLTLTRDEIAGLPHQTVTASAHDQSGRFEGVALVDLLKRAGVPTGEAIRGAELAKSVFVIGADGYRAVFALAELDSAFTDRIVLLADKRDGAALADNARPYQLIVPGEKRPARWVRQVVSIEVR